MLHALPLPRRAFCIRVMHLASHIGFFLPARFRLPTWAIQVTLRTIAEGRVASCVSWTLTAPSLEPRARRQHPVAP